MNVSDRWVTQGQLTSGRESAVRDVLGLLDTAPSVLVCMEADPAFCHRNVLAQHLTTLSDLPIKHLGCPV